MKNITYLFGAGASKNALPIVSELPDRIVKTISTLMHGPHQFTEYGKFDDIKIEHTVRDVQHRLIEDLNWLVDSCSKHQSLDTFAKKLHLRGEFDKLLRLKAAFSAYLAIDQACNPTDSRYDAFFASILNEIDKFPVNVKILSWNYDYQFEKAFAEYSGMDDLQHNQKKLNVISKYSMNSSIQSSFNIIKINGTIGLHTDNGFRNYNFTNSIVAPLSTEILQKILRNYFALLTYKGEVFPMLSFAWEADEEKEESIIDKSKKATIDTQVLVVIGYSFPYFNREIDRKIIQNMTKLQKVYFQAPDADIVKERFLAIKPDLDSSNLISRFNTDQFFLPDEM